LEGSGFHKKDTILIGDQLLTDVFVANRLGIRVILTEKLVKEDQWTTRFNRMIDKPLRRYLKKKQKLKSWRENYD
jgi:predicted HAD superfamily phosphohydrolase YqeG